MARNLEPTATLPIDRRHLPLKLDNPLDYAVTLSQDNGMQTPPPFNSIQETDHDYGRIKKWVTDTHAFKQITAIQDSIIDPIPGDRPFIGMLVSGAVLIRSGARPKIIRPGTFAFYFDRVNQQSVAIERNTSWVVIDCPGHMEKQVRRRVQRGERCVRYDYPKQMASIFRLLSEFWNLTDDREWDFASRIDRLYAGHFQFDDRLTSCSQTAGKLKELLHERRCEFMGLSETAQAMGKNASHLARVFKKDFGITVGEYLRLIRFRDACFAISRGEDSLVQIAVQCGFSDQSHMCRVFKHYSGLTPTQLSIQINR